MQDVTTRLAVIDDAMSICRVRVESWQAAFKGIVPDSYLSSMRPIDRLEGWRSAISGDDEIVVVAELNGTVVGFASVEISGSNAEWNTLYFDPAHWGQGLGRQLHAFVLDEVAKAGVTDIVLWVVQKNVRARRFYERLGWVSTGEVDAPKYDGVAVPGMQYALQMDRTVTPT